MEKWKIFKDSTTGQELTAYTIRGTFPGGEQDTVELIAAEYGMEPARIVTAIEER